MKGRSLSPLLWALFGLATALVVVGLAFGTLNLFRRGGDGDVINMLWVAPAMTFSVVGLQISTRRRTIVGVICLEIGFLWSVVMASSTAGEWIGDVYPQASKIAAWISWPGGLWVLAVGLMGTHLALRLPDGRLRTRRWRHYSWFCTAVVGLSTFVIQTEPLPSNPAGLEVTRPLVPLLVLLPLSFIGGILSLVLRYRAAGSLERLQIRCIAFGCAVFAVAFSLTFAVVGNWDLASGFVANLLITVTALAYAAIPTAIGIAVLRYRLYEIDQIINRTLVYGALTAMLAGAYMIIVTLAGTVLKGSALVTAAATLAVAALFQPLRRRIQGFIDRRFYRSRYDAQRTVEAFSSRLREEVDLEAMRAHLLGAVQQTMQPRRVSIWLRS
jgi:hypothetical protein